MDSLPQLNGSSRRRTAWSKREKHYPVPTSSSKTFALPRRSPVLRQEQITVVRERAKHRIHSTEILPCSVPRVPLERPGRASSASAHSSPIHWCTPRPMRGAGPVFTCAQELQVRLHEIPQELPLDANRTAYFSGRWHLL